jgi:hypothetical protein
MTEKVKGFILCNFCHLFDAIFLARLADFYVAYLFAPPMFPIVGWE